MDQVATETTGTGQSPGLALASRSSVLGQFRTNPFRVLRVPIDVEVDQAIWKAEEVLTRLRAGVPSADPDLLCWLPEPDETETRQAVQRVEEPLRRLTDQMFWFDPDHDPDGDLLRQALVTLDASALGEYLARCLDDGLPRASTASNESFVIDTNSVSTTNGKPRDHDTDQAPREVEAAEVPRLLNHANLRLLLATLSLYDALPEGLEVPIANGGEDGNNRDEIEWSSSNGLTLAENPHDLDLTGGRLASRSRRTVAIWSDALARWLRLVNSRVFLAHVRESIARLGDEVVGEDDAEVIVGATSTRAIDLFVGEVKGQILLGRMDRVRALVEAASSTGVESRLWANAFRPLRPLFRPEADELEPLLPDREGAIDDASVYLSRLSTLKARWESIDPSGHLGLTEIIDEADLKACQSLAQLESYSTVEPIKALYRKSMGLASAESLKQKIAAIVTRLNGFEHHACYFCGSREMDLKRSVVMTGKIESHRTYGFNSTTIHYMLKANIIPRCPRCAELHQYIYEVRGTTWAALGAATVASLGILYLRTPETQQNEAGVYILLGVIAAGVIAMLGYAARWIVAALATPSGEKIYWKGNKSEPYYNMKSEGATMTIDYRRDAFPLFEQRQGQRS